MQSPGHVGWAELGPSIPRPLRGWLLDRPNVPEVACMACRPLAGHAGGLEEVCRPCAGIRAKSESWIVGLTQAPASIDVDTPLQTFQRTTMLMPLQSLQARCQSFTRELPKCFGYSGDSRAAQAARCSREYAQGCALHFRGRAPPHTKTRRTCVASPRHAENLAGSHASGCAYPAGGHPATQLSWKTSYSSTYAASKSTENLHAMLEQVAVSVNCGSSESPHNKSSALLGPDWKPVAPTETFSLPS